MNNKTVQQKLCTEPKTDPQEAFQFAIAYEEGINQHRAFEGGSAIEEIKNEPLSAVNERRIPCNKCGLVFSQSHLAVCKAKNERCRNCALIGHFARMCKKPNTGNMGRRGTMGIRASMWRINLIEQGDDQSEDSNVFEEDKMVLHVGGGGNQPFIMKGKINNESFTTMIDSGSPITIFTQIYLRRLLKQDVIFARPLPKTEQNEDYNNKPQIFLGS